MRSCRGCGGRGRREGRAGWDGASREGKRGQGLPGGCRLTSAPSAAAAARADWEREAMGSTDSPGCPPRDDTQPACIPPRAGQCRAHARPPFVTPRPVSPPRWGTVPRPGVAHACPSPVAASGLGQRRSVTAESGWKGARRHTLCLREAGKR